MLNVVVNDEMARVFVPVMIDGSNDNDSGAKNVFVITMNPNSFVFSTSYTSLQKARARVHTYIAESTHHKTGFREFDGNEEVYVLDGGLYTIVITKTKLVN